MNWYKKAIVSPEQAKELLVKKRLPSDETFTKAVQNTKGARITRDGLELDVMRNQHPDQSGRPSVRSGIFYQPSGSPAKYPYSGKQGYGGVEQIRGTTLLRRPLFVKGATGGKAPKMAYDMLKGNGAYERMREDILTLVLNTYPWAKKSTRDMVVDIRRVLGKYGGEIELAEEMNEFRLKTKGNNFAYAMQENIVANAVRKAGYDSVVGWSARKDGTPFLSEIFDVRETTYPSKVSPGGEVHQTLLKNVGP